MNTFEYNGSLYRTQKDAQLACLDEWFTDHGMNTDPEALDYAQDHEDAHNFAAELHHFDWEIPGMDVSSLRFKESDVSALEDLLKTYVRLLTFSLAKVR